MHKIILFTLALILLVSPASGAHPDYQAAGILRGEAPEDCAPCRQITACALVTDLEKGVHLRSRWYGWRNPRAEDYTLLEWARQERNCAAFPVCKFVGNGKDLEVWARKGWIDSATRVIAHCSSQGCTVCVPVEIDVSAMR